MHLYSGYFGFSASFGQTGLIVRPSPPPGRSCQAEEVLEAKPEHNYGAREKKQETERRAAFSTTCSIQGSLCL